MDTNFQPLPKSFDHVYEALKVPSLVGISPIWAPSEPHTRGQTTSEVAENWCPLRFWPKVPRGVWGIIPKKNWAGLIDSLITQDRIGDDNFEGGKD